MTNTKKLSSCAESKVVMIPHNSKTTAGVSVLLLLLACLLAWLVAVVITPTRAGKANALSDDARKGKER